MADVVDVLVAEDDALAWRAIRDILHTGNGLRVVGQARDGNEVWRLSLKLAPQLLLMDPDLPGPPPGETVARLRRHCPRVKVLVLSGRSDDFAVHSLLAAGVAGYLVKDEAEVALVAAVQAVARGDPWYSARVSASAVARAQGERRAAEGPAALSERELRVLGFVARGHGNRGIAQALGISERTVRFHLENVRGKLHLETEEDVVRWTAGDRGRS